MNSLQQTSNAIFTLNCSSSGSPATNVSWTKDGEVLMLNETFMSTQYLRNGQRAIYDSTLTISLSAADILGTYTCAIENQISQVSQATLTVQGNTFY